MSKLERQVFAEELVLEAGSLAASFRHGSGIAIRSKGVLDWVTEADLATERLIRDRIGSAFPTDRVFGEEGSNPSSADRKDRYVWVVDPIDGTTPFVTGLPSWCVSIACVDPNGRPFLGVVRDHTADETFSAADGGGLTLNGQRVIPPAKGLRDGLVAVGHPRNRPSEPTLTFLSRLFEAKGQYYNAGSAALALAYVAVGRLIGFYESDLRAWDALAGEMLVRESGGLSTSFLRDQNLEGSKPVLAANSGSGSAIWKLADGLVSGLGPGR